MAKVKLLKSKFYAVNPWNKTISKKPYDRAKEISWKYRNEDITKVRVGRKPKDLKVLLKKGFKFI